MPDDGQLSSDRAVRCLLSQHRQLEDPEWSRAVLGLLRREGEDDRQPAAIVLDPGQVQVHFAGPPRLPPGSPFERRSELTWALGRHSGSVAALPGAPAIVSASRRAALVTTWDHDGCKGLLDLVACGSVALDGPPVTLGLTLSQVITELSMHRWCDLDELAVVGCGSGSADLKHAVVLDSVDAAMHHLLACRADKSSPAAARCLIVFPLMGSPSRGRDSLAALVELVHLLPETGMLCCDASLPSVRSVWSLDSGRRTREVQIKGALSLRARLRPVMASLQERAAGRIARAEAGASAVAQAASRALARQGALGGAARRSGLPSTSRSQRRPVLVKILGPVDVSGTRGPLGRRPRVSELIVYLSLHRDGCSKESIAAALWPDRNVPRQTIANRLSEARRALGETWCGEARLQSVSGRHVLSEEVSTDWQEFEGLTAAGTSQTQWSRALRLVRGVPFEGLSQGGWTLLEGFLPSIQGRIATVAHRLAQRRLAASDPAEAEWAVRSGLKANPWDERLYRMLMVVAHATGSRAGIEAAINALARVLEWPGRPIDGVHRETAQLYRRLTADPPCPESGPAL